MGSFNGLWIGFSFVFGGLFLGFVVTELYYVLWRKKRAASGGGSFLFCWKKKPSSFNSSNSSEELGNAQESMDEQQDLELEVGSSQDLGLKGYGEEGVGSSQDLGLKGYGEEGVETELIRLHNLRGPPRFLFTIKEENREDLESEDGRSRGDKSSRKGSRTRSLSDLVYADGGTPFFTPLSSPTNRAPIWDSCYNGFNPFFEPLTDAELDRLRSSPPPTFKFMKDAEDKFLKMLMDEAERKRGGGLRNDHVKESRNSSVDDRAEKDDSLASCVDKRLLRGQIHYQASQVLPLA